MYASVLFVHVLAGLLLVGGSFSAPLVRRKILDSETVPELRSWLAFAERSTRFNPLFALVLLGTGVYLGHAGWWSAGWFYVALAAWFANLFLAGFVIKGSARRLGIAAGAAGDGLVPEEIDRLRRRKGWDLAEESLLANDIAILYAMMLKPSLLVSAGVLVAANAVLIAVGELRRRRAETSGLVRAEQPT